MLEGSHRCGNICACKQVYFCACACAINDTLHSVHVSMCTSAHALVLSMPHSCSGQSGLEKNPTTINSCNRLSFSISSWCFGQNNPICLTPPNGCSWLDNHFFQEGEGNQMHLLVPHAPLEAKGSDHACHEVDKVQKMSRKSILKRVLVHLPLPIQ